MPKSIINYRLIVVLALVILTTRLPFHGMFSIASDITPGSVAQSVNNQRVQRNISGLTTNSKLAAAASYKASDMITRRYFAHVDPDGHYIWDKIISQGYNPYTTLGENLAIEFQDTSSLIDAWMNSPTHRENILNAAFKDQGVGVAFGNTNDGEYSVAVANTFGAQPAKASAPAPKPAPKPAATAPKPTPVVKPTPAPKPVATKPQTQPKPTTKTPAKTTPAPKPTPKPVSTSTPNTSTPIASIPTPIQTQPQTSLINISTQDVQLAPHMENNQLVLGISVHIDGEPSSVAAVVQGHTANLTLANDQTYSGQLTFERHFDIQKEVLAIETLDSKGAESTLNIPLKNLPIPEQVKEQNEISGPTDLYNIYKYLLIGFAILFIILLIGEVFFFTKDKFSTAVTKGSNIIVLLLLIGTLLLVRWQ